MKTTETYKSLISKEQITLNELVKSLHGELYDILPVFTTEEAVIKSFGHLFDEEKWDNDDIRYIKNCIVSGFGPFLDRIFLNKKCGEFYRLLRLEILRESEIQIATKKFVDRNRWSPRDLIDKIIYYTGFIVIITIGGSIIMGVIDIPRLLSQYVL